jgi:predicted permease
MEINFNSVSAGYFAALGIPIVDGRGFDERDRASGAPVAVVNETMAARYWPGARAIGRRVVIDPTTPPAEVIGVARDVKYRMLRETAGPSFYLPLDQAPARRGVLHVRVPGDPAEQLPGLRRALAAVDPNVPIGNVRTLRRQADRNMNDERVAMLIAFVLGGAALLLAAVGLYGAMAYAVGQRARELAVRVALGARARDIRRLILSQGWMVSILGAALGSGLAVVVGRAIENRLFGVRPGDALTIGGAAVVMLLVALAASWVPARRACRVDPIETLRIE